ncbi:diaminopimelate decarboxylase [Mucilaginibacter frigoritolerans]|uniref:Diaminopimelate decarboxylase n=1 Tax=Mucilaginibacter frigoritolerans TaxID=652788 RepID=A0A562UAH8_9SPHI|nr:diaminopimelate decarboxylase [Mucilaginibacter frigoritolerans]TWJ02417.1 diaminopimelate decarboxylase [Mucilaginibacter frigoritolerans]
MNKLKYERPYIKKLTAGAMNKFGSLSGSQPFKFIDNVPVKSLVEAYGSPLFVISEKHIRRNYRAAYRAFSTRYPKVQFAWSYKTNYLNAVCNIFHQEGSWAEVVSGFEYQKALGNGVPGNKIIFNGPGKSKKDLLLAVENDSLIHIDHLEELGLLLPLCEGLDYQPKVAIRVNMDTGVYPLWDRFGFNYENGEAWRAILKIVNSGKLKLTGLHCHIGTYIQTTAAYGVAASKMAALAIKCNTELKQHIEYLDLGGGFPSTNTLKGAYLPGTDTMPTIDDFAEEITGTLIRAGFENDDLPLLILESGRLLIDDAGYLLGTVLANKRLSDGKLATIVDIGVNILFTSFWYDHQVSPADDYSPTVENTVIYGPLCMNIDVIRESVNLPLLKSGDHIVIHKVGAYNMTQWMQFIALRPAIVLIDEQEQVHLIKAAETLEHIETNEYIPEHLK